MVGLAEIGGAISSLKAIKDIAQGLNAANTQTAINEIQIGLQSHVIDAQSAIMSAQANEAALLQRIDDLEKQIAAMKNWEAEKERYELKAIDRGAVAYMHKAGMEGGEPPVWLCQQCFEQKHKSPLTFQRSEQARGPHGLQSLWACNRCKSTVSLYYGRQPSEPYEAA